MNYAEEFYKSGEFSRSGQLYVRLSGSGSWSGTYINISRNQTVNEKIKAVTGLTNLDALYLTKTEVEALFENGMSIDS